MALYPWLSITRVMNYLAASTPSLALLHLWPWWQWLIITVSGEKKSACMCFQTSPTILFAESFIIPISNEECTPVHSTSDFPSIIEGSERQKARVLPHGHPEQRGTKNWSHLSFAGSLLHQAALHSAAENGLTEWPHWLCLFRGEDRHISGRARGEEP